MYTFTQTSYSITCKYVHHINILHLCVHTHTHTHKYIYMHVDAHARHREFEPCKSHRQKHPRLLQNPTLSWDMSYLYAISYIYLYKARFCVCEKHPRPLQNPTPSWDMYVSTEHVCVCTSATKIFACICGKIGHHHDIYVSTEYVFVCVSVTKTFACMCGFSLAAGQKEYGVYIHAIHAYIYIYIYTYTHIYIYIYAIDLTCSSRGAKRRRRLYGQGNGKWYCILSIVEAALTYHDPFVCVAIVCSDLGVVRWRPYALAAWLYVYGCVYACGCVHMHYNLFVWFLVMGSDLGVVDDVHMHSLHDCVRVCVCVCVFVNVCARKALQTGAQVSNMMCTWYTRTHTNGSLHPTCP